MKKSVLLAAIQKEIQRHDLSYSLTNRHRSCRKRINTMQQFLDHLANDAMPALIDMLAMITSTWGLLTARANRRGYWQFCTKRT